MPQRDEEFKAIQAHLNNQMYFIRQFLEKADSKEYSSRYLLYEFQSLMDGLIPIKERADALTRTFDHG